MKSELTTAYSIRIGQYARGTAASGGKADIAAVAGAGFTTLINNRPDGEAQVQPDSDVPTTAAQRHGLAYYHVPVVPGQYTDTSVNQLRELLAQAEGPVLALCRTGNRSISLWALSQAARLEPEAILTAAKNAGYDLQGMQPHKTTRDLILPQR